VIIDLTSYKQKLIQQGISDVVIHIDSFSVRYQF